MPCIWDHKLGISLADIRGCFLVNNTSALLKLEHKKI